MLNQFNAAMELSVVVMMIALLFASLVKREKKAHNNIIIYIIGVDIMALVCDFGLWMAYGDSNRVFNIKVLFGLSYILAYILILLFHYYLLTLISLKSYVPKSLYYIPIPLVIIETVIYFSSYSNGIFFVITKNGDYIHGQLDWVNQLIRVSLLLIDVVITVFFSGKLGVKQTVLILIYETVPIASFFFENRYRLGIIYIAVSVLILIEYISVSVEQDVLLAKQKQHMAEQEKKLTVERTKIMISQIGPHFLYNAISSIDFFLPALTLQPLVENAVKHGIGQKAEGGTVTLTTSHCTGGIKITVSDDGVGFDKLMYEKSDKSEYIGISNVKSRLSVMCSGKLTVESEKGKGTVVTVFLPDESQI